MDSLNVLLGIPKLFKCGGWFCAVPLLFGLCSPLPDDVIYRSSINSRNPSSPLGIADRLVAEAIRRSSLTNRPLIVKYPPDFFNGSAEPSSSSSEEEKTKKKRQSKKMDS